MVPPGREFCEDRQSGIAQYISGAEKATSIRYLDRIFVYGAQKCSIINISVFRGINIEASVASILKPISAKSVYNVSGAFIVCVRSSV